VLETALIGRHPHLARWQWESAADVARARDALAAFGLEGLDTRDVRTLSGGERRRLALAALVAQEPEILLLDEPSSHLDLGQQIAALDVVTALARERGKAIVMVLTICISRRASPITRSRSAMAARASAPPPTYSRLRRCRSSSATDSFSVGEGARTTFIPS
jgi:ABC-type nitrate/sulfonate/bicarbonate transport system ATPase subunit